jgi:hypothetical protein
MRAVLCRMQTFENTLVQGWVIWLIPVARRLFRMGRASLEKRSSYSSLQGGIIVWWADLLWGSWNGLTAWIVLIVHVFGGWEQFPFYNEASSGNWYDFGFLLGAGSPLLEPAAFSRAFLLMN